MEPHVSLCNLKGENYKKRHEAQYAHTPAFIRIKMKRMGEFGTYSLSVHYTVSHFTPLPW